ncbi:MAG: DUF4006 family protein [Thiovulaceae bacterium]|jgi:hypothetical protein|nr:DUF4006 family protein [Sulfurimonadaceae bacterium]
MVDNNFKGSGVFSLDGITGMLIATVLLLSILAGLTIWGLGVQQANQQKFYKVVDEKSIKMIDPTNGTHRVLN